MGGTVSPEQYRSGGQGRSGFILVAMDTALPNLLRNNRTGINAPNLNSSRENRPLHRLS